MAFMHKLRNSSAFFRCYDRCCSPGHVLIRNVETIVKLSPVVQKSLTHLDLSLCEYSIFKGKRKNTSLLEMQDLNHYVSFPIEISNDFHCTKTNWRRIFGEGGRLHQTHTFYVDLVIEFPKPYRYWKILIPHYFYQDLVPGLIDNVVERIKHTTSPSRVTLARKILKPLKSFIYLSNNRSYVHVLAHIFYSDCTDLNIWQEFFGAFRIEEYILFAESACYSPEVTERLLHYAYMSGFNFKRNSLNRDLILHCFPKGLYNKVNVLLKFISAPKYCPYTHQQCRSDLFNRRDRLGLINPMRLVREKPSNKERSFLMLQVIHAFLLYGTKGRHALRLIWSSIPDAYITREEMADQYEEIVTARHITDVWNFYRDIVGDCSCLKPRSLQHYCRVFIRTTLSDNEQLYEGIDKLDLYYHLKLYLKLVE